MTIVEWVDVFTRKENRYLVIDSLRYCINEKGLNVYAYCIMSNHIHLIANCNEPFELKDTIRDFKKFTSKSLLSAIKNGIESRREWMLDIEKAGTKDNKNKTYKVWQTGNHAIELYSEKFTWEKVNYIHQNPVRSGFVEKQEDWVYSSSSNYADKVDAILKEVVCLTPRLITI